jgi:thymidylate synthase (FAD)
MHDVLTNVANPTIHCLNKGFVKIIDTMPRLVPEGQKTADGAVVQMARVSYGEGTKTVNEDRGLIRYLMRHAHTTPFEGVEFKFHCKMPIFVARQWIRHRTANVNEVSGRYSVLADDFYFPEESNVREQSTRNKQGGDDTAEIATAQSFLAYLDRLCINSYDAYEDYLEQGVSREQARMCLPLNLYTEWYWKIDLHNLFHFLALRCDSHAQWEIRVFADAMLEMIKPIVPWCVEAWDDYHPMRGALKLTRLEVEAVRRMLTAYSNEQPGDIPQIESDNKREKQEWEAKAALLGIGG